MNKNTLIYNNLKRIINEPYFLIKNIKNAINTIYYYYLSKKNDFDLKSFRENEIKKYYSLNFDYNNSLNNLNEKLKKLGKENFKSSNSNHWLLFSALSLQKKKKINNILEIGTFTGEGTEILSELFPFSKIDTVDLPESDPIFSDTYGNPDSKQYDKYISKRNRVLNQPNVSFHEINSFFLLTEFDGNKFDLIWVDGGHLYPDVAWDLCNCYHLCNSGGYILIDDIKLSNEMPIIDNYKNQPKYVNDDSYKTIEYILNRTSLDVTYFIKRDRGKYLANPFKRKYIAVLKINEK